VCDSLAFTNNELGFSDGLVAGADIDGWCGLCPAPPPMRVAPVATVTRGDVPRCALCFRPYQCGHCSQSFSQPSELRNHVVTHSSDRPFKCGYCGRAFAGATTLNNHIRTHTGEKPF
ncbi:hypothetical protein M9458_019133, partial [Cirrhinus mrigala]